MTSFCIADFQMLILIISTINVSISGIGVYTIAQSPAKSIMRCVGKNLFSQAALLSALRREKGPASARYDGIAVEP